MLDRLIRLSLDHRLLVLALAGFLLVFGSLELASRPVDIFPDLNQPVVTALAEAPGFAPEEVETLITLPIEASLAGAPGVERIRSTSGDGLAIIRAEFGWGTDVLRDRQIVQERLQLASGELPPGVVPEMAPISSITGEILDLGLVSPNGRVSLMELRTLAAWTVRRRLLSVRGVSQVVIIGGDHKQFQVSADPTRMLSQGVGISQLAQALERASRNTSGGYLVEGSREMLVRNLGRLRGVGDIEDLVVSASSARAVRVRDVARVEVAAQFPRGAASVDGQPGVVLVVFKQPGADTLALTDALDREVVRIRRSLPDGVVLRNDLFRQAAFLRRGVDHVIEALRDGAVLVVVVLLLFLLNLRASLITLVSLPLSFATAGVLFSLFDLSLNTMTLGGLAIAVGELVDDAIVGVENTVRRLRQQVPGEGPNWFSCLVADASCEVRGPIFSGTLVVVLVFAPLFALSGIEGRLFSPLALAYVVSLLASMVVSLTVTPVLALLLFRRQAYAGLAQSARRGAPALRWLRAAADRTVQFAVKNRFSILGGTCVLLAAGVGGAWTLGSQFLPEFDEGTIMVLMNLPPGTSLAESNRMGRQAEQRLVGLPGVKTIARYTGRGEHDEHAPPVGVTHLLVSLDPESGIPRSQMLHRVRTRLAHLKGVEVSVGQPLAHRIDHLLSGVQAQVAIKVSGPDLDVLRAAVLEVAGVARRIPGVTDLYIEPQVLVPQVHVALKKDRLAELGLSPGALATELEVAVGGRVVGSVLEGERAFDLFLRLDKSARSSLNRLRQLPVPLPGGGWARLSDVARVTEDVGPNRIRRDNLVRRVAVSCNTDQRSVGEVVADLRRAVRPVEQRLPKGTSIRFEGQFASEAHATRLIVLLSLFSLGVVTLILYAQFRSFNLAVQVLGCVPVAFLGGVAFLLLTGQHFSVAALVGFVSLAGIATRNGILLISHYLFLMRAEQRGVTVELLTRAGKERAAPVVMTALTTGVGLLPLLGSAGETGREILYPVATVVIGGLLTSTLFEFLLRPALFWTLGQRAAERVVSREQTC